MLLERQTLVFLYFINSAEGFTRDLFQDQRKSGKGMREAIAMANQAFHLELNVSV